MLRNSPFDKILDHVLVRCFFEQRFETSAVVVIGVLDLSHWEELVLANKVLETLSVRLAGSQTERREQRQCHLSYVEIVLKAMEALPNKDVQAVEVVVRVDINVISSLDTVIPEGITICYLS